MEHYFLASGSSEQIRFEQVMWKHAKNDQHTHAMMLLTKEKARAAGQGPLIKVNKRSILDNDSLDDLLALNAEKIPLTLTHVLTCGRVQSMKVKLLLHVLALRPLSDSEHSDSSEEDVLNQWDTYMLDLDSSESDPEWFCYTIIIVFLWFECNSFNFVHGQLGIVKIMAVHFLNLTTQTIVGTDIWPYSE